MLLLIQNSRWARRIAQAITSRQSTAVQHWRVLAAAAGCVVLFASSLQNAAAQPAASGQSASGTSGPLGAMQTQTGIAQIPTTAPPVTPTQTHLQAVNGAESARSPLPGSPGSAYIAAHLGQDHALTLEQVIGIALSNNRDLAFAAEALYRAEGKLAESKTAFLPTVSAQPADVYLHSINEGSFAVAATLPIDITGLLKAAEDQAHFQEVGARLDYNKTRNQVVYNADAAFYSVLRDQALVTVSVQNLQDSLERLRDANVRYKAQAVPYLDVVRVQTDVANAQKVVIQARNKLSVDVGLLNNAMGIDVTLPTRVDSAGSMELPPGITPVPDINPAGPASPAELPSAPAPPTIAEIESANTTAQRSSEVISQALALGPEFHKVLDEALNTRPEILEADALISAAKKGIIIAQRSILPSLSLSVGYFDIRSQTGTQINEPEGIIGLNIPLYDAGLARARVQQARADVSTAITTRREQSDFVTIDVQQAYLNLVQAQDEVAVANQAVVQARVAFQIARVRYIAGVGSRAGLSPILEFADAQTALTLAEQNRVNALYDYNAARASLDRSIGRFAYLRVGPGYTAPPPAKTVGRKP